VYKHWNTPFIALGGYYIGVTMQYTGSSKKMVGKLNRYNFCSMPDRNFYPSSFWRGDLYVLLNKKKLDIKVLFIRSDHRQPQCTSSLGAGTQRWRGVAHPRRLIRLLRWLVPSVHACWRDFSSTLPPSWTPIDKNRKKHPPRFNIWTSFYHRLHDKLALFDW